MRVLQNAHVFLERTRVGSGLPDSVAPFVTVDGNCRDGVSSASRTDAVLTLVPVLPLLMGMQ